MELGLIYMATAPSGKRYIGKTERTLAKRVSEHKSQNHCPAIHAALKKYGDAVQWRILAVVGVDFLDDTERFYIAELKPEYNGTDGGDGGKPTAQARAKMSASGKGKPKPQGFGAKISAAHTGKKRPPRTAEWRANQSAKMKGRKQSPEHIAKRAAARKGKTISPETCAKISAKLKGRKESAETCAKKSAAKMGNKNSLGHKQTPEHRAKISAGGKRRWARKRQRKTGMLV